ncbi:MAG: hypothetical protein ACRDYF_05630 [Acidimicrobiia bacterium]
MEFNSGTGEPDGLTPRLLARIRQDFPNDAERVVGMLEAVESGRQDRERVLAGVVVPAEGDLDALRSLIELSQQDWRDVLMCGLEHGDWPEVLDRWLGPA